jgi:hypothetical protein
MINTCTNTRGNLTAGVCRAGTLGFALVAVLVCSAPSAADILNGSFEQSYSVTPWPDTVPAYWRLKNTDHTAFGSQVTTVWKTEGLRAAGIFSRYGRFLAAGDYQSVYQVVNLTGIGRITFDARLANYGGSTAALAAFDEFEAALLVDGVPVWTQTSIGTYLNQQVNIPRRIGYYPVELRLTAKASGQFYTAHWMQWDNLRLIDGPVETIIDAGVNVDPNTLNLNSKGNWITCYIELPEGYDIANINAQNVTLADVHAYIGEEGWASPETRISNTVDRDGDGVLERMVKFDRSAVQAALKPGDITVLVKGKLPDYVTFQGTDVIHVIGKAK